MLRRILILLFLLSLTLAGCQSQAPTTATGPVLQDTGTVVTQSDLSGEASPGSPETESPAPDETKAPEQTEVGPSVSTTTGEEASTANCTVVSREPTPGPTQESLFPPPGESDWVVGPETAEMTIYEYSDFQ